MALCAYSGHGLLKKAFFSAQVGVMTCDTGIGGGRMDVGFLEVPLDAVVAAQAQFRRGVHRSALVARIAHALGKGRMDRSADEHTLSVASVRIVAARAVGPGDVLPGVFLLKGRIQIVASGAKIRNLFKQKLFAC